MGIRASSLICMLLLAACGIGESTAAVYSNVSPLQVAVPITHAPINVPISPNLLVAGTGLLPWGFNGRFSPGAAQPAQPQTFSWGASSISATFTGTSIQTNLIPQGPTYFEMWVDDGAPQTFDPSQGQLSFTGLSQGQNHTVTLIKRTEGAYGTALFNGFTLDANGVFLPSPLLSARRISIIGDAISNGYGDLGSSATCMGSSGNEDTTLAYGPTVARSLGANYEIIAWSGKGVYRNTDGTTAETMPVIWQRSVVTSPQSTFDTTLFQPQVIIVNLGTSDFYLGVPDSALFETAYVNFLTTLRQAYPQAFIICALGPLLYGANLQAATSYMEAVVQIRNDAGDNQVSLTIFPTVEVAENGTGAGCDYQPDLLTQMSMANTLVSQIRALLAW